MFGGSSGWGQQNQTQQPNTGGGLFGNTTSTFGQNTGGFGTQNTGGFGQPQQQQQQNTGGIFGGGGNTSTFSGFGNNANTAQPNNAFGQSRPTFGATGSTFGSNTGTGGGLFGSAPASTTTFGGTPSTGGGLFGAKPATTSTFGSGTTSGLFGPKPAGNTFGVAAGQPNPNQIFQYSAGPYPPPPSTGTAQPAYFPTWQQDSTPATIGVGVKDTPPLLFHAITAMEPYRGASWEELRAVDYQQNRKEPTAQPSGGFGTTSNTFGQPQQQQQNAFGQTNAASNPFAPKPAGSMFGTQPSAAPSFGGTSGIFGQNNANAGTSSGMFGTTQQPQQPTFGQTNSGAGSSIFGTGQQNQQPNQGGGLFQNPNPFGTNNQQPAATSAFPGFGSTANKPAFGSTPGFGTQSTTPSFGQTPTTTNPPAFGSFGTGQQQPQQNTSGGLFGPSSTPSFGQTQPASTGMFPSQNQQTTTQQNGSLFGPSAAKPPLFGNTQATTNTSTPSFGFGTQNQQPASTGIFNTQPAQPAAGTTGSLFGPQSQQTQQPGQTSSIFNNSSSLFKPAASTSTPPFSFNNNNSTAQQPGNTQAPAFGSLGQSGGLFGPNNGLGTQNNASKPPGQTQFTGGSLFGPNLTQPSTQPSSLIFGGALGQSQPAQTGFLGNSAQPAQQGTGLLGGIFNQPQAVQQQQQQQQQQQPTLTASLDQNPYGRNELFTYNGQKLDFSVQPKKPALPPLTASSFRISTPSKSRSVLRGFASPALSASLGRSSPARVGSPKPDRWAGLSEAALTPNAFVPRPSIKKLTITPTSQTDGSAEDRLESVLGKSLVGSTTPARAAASPVANGNNTPAPAPGRNAQQSPQVPGTAPPPAEGQYWCKPSLQRLKQMSKQDLSAINRFSAGRTGYGEVTFLQPVDLTQIDLDQLLGNIIHFREMELAVYPDNYPNKPSRGQGLNVPAQISLHNCFAKDKATGAFITDMSDPRHVRFLKRVKSIKDTEFVSYTDEGIWTFKVEHFSKYGLNDDSDESDQDAVRPVTDEEDDMPPLRSMHDKPEDEEHDSGIEDEDGEFEATSSGSQSLSGSSVSEAMDGDDGDIDYYQEEYVEPIKLNIGHQSLQKLRQMQSSLFSEIKGAMPDRAERGTKRAAADRVKRLLNEQEQGFEHAGEDESALGRRATKRASFGDPVSPPKLRLPRKYAKVELAQSLVNHSEGVRADGGLALGRSFRCSWGPDGQLVHFGKICAPATSFSSPSSAQVSIATVPLLASTDQVEAGKAKRLLRLHLSHTSVSTEDGNVPSAALSTNTRFRDLAGLFEGSDISHEASIFRLGVALFDEIDLRLPLHSSEELVQRIGEVRRKLKLSKWLENAVSASVDQDLVVNADDLPKKVFSLLTGNQVDRAVDAALQGKDMRLASLISQSGGPEEFKEELLLQLDDWNKYNSTSFISPEYRRIYALLAGVADLSPSEPSTGASPDVLVAKGLDWKRAIGLRLWYSMPFSSTISEVLDDYTAALTAPHAPSKPLPPYIESPKEERQWNIPAEPTDVLYGLIRLYADVGLSLDTLLRPRESSPSPLDFRLPWHLYMLLSRVLQKRDFGDRDEEGYSARADGLTQGYAKQLEDCQEWTMAAFVLLHLETENGREAALRSLLFRHPEPSDTEVNFLTRTLHIPIQWVHESAAAFFASLDDPWREYHSLISAGLTDRAQRVLIARLAPEIILRDDLNLLRKLCALLEQRPPTGWDQGAKLFVEYADISEEVPRLLALALTRRTAVQDDDADRLADVAHQVGRTIQLLPALFPDSANVQQVAVLSDMLSRLHDLAGSLARAGLIERPSLSSAPLLGADRLHLLQAKAFDAFEKNLTATTAVA